MVRCAEPPNPVLRRGTPCHCRRARRGQVRSAERELRWPGLRARRMFRPDSPMRRTWLRVSGTVAMIIPKAYLASVTRLNVSQAVSEALATSFAGAPGASSGLTAPLARTRQIPPGSSGRRPGKPVRRTDGEEMRNVTLRTSLGQMARPRSRSPYDGISLAGLSVVQWWTSSNAARAAWPSPSTDQGLSGRRLEGLAN